MSAVSLDNGLNFPIFLEYQLLIYCSHTKDILYVITLSLCDRDFLTHSLWIIMIQCAHNNTTRFDKLQCLFSLRSGRFHLSLETQLKGTRKQGASGRTMQNIILFSPFAFRFS